MEAGEELARRGHNVTVVSPFSSKRPVQGVREILIENKAPLINSNASQRDKPGEI